jgi:hypothetical protein
MLSIPSHPRDEFVRDPTPILLNYASPKTPRHRDDLAHLAALVVSYFVWGAVMILSSAVAFATVWSSPDARLMVPFMYGLACVCSAVAIRRRTWRLLSIGVGAITCLAVPLGSVLGICTLMVLSRASVVAKYAE